MVRSRHTFKTQLARRLRRQATQAERRAYDLGRDAVLRGLGLEVVRLRDSEVDEANLARLLSRYIETHRHVPLSRKRERGQG